MTPAESRARLKFDHLTYLRVSNEMSYSVWIVRLTDFLKNVTDSIERLTVSRQI